MFLPIANYPQFILNQYQEVDQKLAHTELYVEDKRVTFKVHGYFCNNSVRLMK